MLHSGNYVTQMLVFNPLQSRQSHACAMQFEKLNLEVEHVIAHRQHPEALFPLHLTMYIDIQNRAAPPLASVEKIRKFI